MDSDTNHYISIRDVSTDRTRIYRFHHIYIMNPWIHDAICLLDAGNNSVNKWEDIKGIGSLFVTKAGRRHYAFDEDR